MIFTSLRGRLVLSHVLPFLVLIPVLGIALVYMIETQVVLASLAEELKVQASLVSQSAREHEEIWNDPDQAQVFVVRMGEMVTARIVLLDIEGDFIASNDPTFDENAMKRSEGPDLEKVLAGESTIRLNYTRSPDKEIADIFVPIFGIDQQPIGVLRLTHQLSSVEGRFDRLHALIAGILTAGLLVGSMTGLLLALNLERPIRQVTSSIYQLAIGYPDVLPEKGLKEIRLLLRSFNTLVRRLHDVEESRRQLLAKIVHEIGRPLGALLSALQALEIGGYHDDALRNDLLAGMEAQVKHLRRLTDDLAHLHNKLFGTSELRRCPTYIGEWLREVAAPWREAAVRKGLDLQISIPQTMPTINIDQDRMAQAVENLLSNATKYTPSGGRVTLTSGTAGDFLWIEVSDSGPGIPASEHEGIFKPFYRGKATRRFQQGTGLGLSIAYELVSLHGGSIELNSAPGQGSRFRVTIPLTPPVPSQERDSS